MSEFFDRLLLLPRNNGNFLLIRTACCQWWAVDDTFFSNKMFNCKRKKKKIHLSIRQIWASTQRWVNSCLEFTWLCLSIGAVHHSDLVKVLSSAQTRWKAADEMKSWPGGRGESRKQPGAVFVCSHSPAPACRPLRGKQPLSVRTSQNQSAEPVNTFKGSAKVRGVCGAQSADLSVGGPTLLEQHFEGKSQKFISTC